MIIKIYPHSGEPEIKDLSDKTSDQRQGLFKKWKNGAYDTSKIECLCTQSQRVLPTLHLRERKKNIGLVNNRSNLPDAHDISCELNSKYKERMKKHGINVDIDGNLVVDKLLDKGKKKTKENEQSKAPQNKNNSPNRQSFSLSKSRLSTLFSVMLESVGLDNYVPGQDRKVSRKILAAASKVIIEGEHMIKGSEYKVFVAKQYEDSQGVLKPLKLGNNPKRKGHNLVIGWGNIEENTEVIKGGKIPDKICIPLYSLDNNSVHIENVEVLKNVYNKEIKSRWNGCKTGFWVIWRVQHEKYDYIFEDKRIAFIPSEETIKMPVESLKEVEMVKYLVQHNIPFKKPLISDLEEDIKVKYRPDFVFYDTTPYTIVEVAGISNDEYLKQLEHKERVYRSTNYLYKRWVPSRETIEDFFGN